MPKLYLICGIPVSGKTTVAKEIATAEDDAVVLSFDDIRLELYDGLKCGSKQNKEVFKTIQAMFKKAVNDRRNIIIDAINGDFAARRAYARLAKKCGYQTFCVHCQKHYIHAVIANHMRDESIRVPNGFIIDSHHNFRPPDKHEGWDSIRIINGDKYSVEVEGQSPLRDYKTREPKKA